MMATIIIADPLDSSAKILLEKAGHEVIDVSSNKEKLLVELENCDGLIVRSATKVNKDMLNRAHKLQIVGRAGVGLDNIDLEECKKRKIKVVNSPEGPTRSVAELALGLLIATSRRISYVDAGTKEGMWPKKTKGHELYGKTLGIIGTGAIGNTLANYASALGMNVIGYDVVENSNFKEKYKYVTLEELFKSSDYISLHVPLLPSTYHMINEKSFKVMKKGVIIINTSRGGTIDEEALLDAINSGLVAGAALDVYENEPINKDSMLLKNPKIITTAHIGAQTYDASLNNTQIVCKKIINHFRN